MFIIEFLCRLIPSERSLTVTVFHCVYQNVSEMYKNIFDAHWRGQLYIDDFIVYFWADSIKELSAF